jgi:hypothetical protein
VLDGDFGRSLTGIKAHLTILQVPISDFGGGNTMQLLVANAPPIGLAGNLVAAILGYGLVIALAWCLRGRPRLGPFWFSLVGVLLAVIALTLGGLTDGRGVLAYLFGAAGAVVVGRWQASTSIVSAENKNYADGSRRRIWRAARSVLVGVAVGLLLFAVWYSLASREELVDASGYFGMFVGMGLFGGSVAAVLVTLLAGTGDGQRRM